MSGATSTLLLLVLPAIMFAARDDVMGCTVGLLTFRRVAHQGMPLASANCRSGHAGSASRQAASSCLGSCMTGDQGAQGSAGRSHTFCEAHHRSAASCEWLLSQVVQRGYRRSSTGTVHPGSCVLCILRRVFWRARHTSVLQDLRGTVHDSLLKLYTHLKGLIPFSAPSHCDDMLDFTW